MALTTCPSCNQQLSDEAATCPHCGHPMKQRDSQKEARAAFKSSSITGLIGGGSFIVLIAVLSAGMLSSSSDTSADVSVSVGSASSPILYLLGFIAIILATACFIAGLALGKKLKRTPAIILSTCTLVASIAGLLGMVLFFGMIALCGGWMFLWQPVLEVIGASKMLSSAMKFDE